MKKFLLALVVVIASFHLYAQTYNNEWIDYSKTYYRFKVGANGLYRISQSALNTLGLAATPVQNFQLWRQGVEVPLYTTVASGTMGTSDYLEFYGQVNDGSLDKKLYKQDSLQMNGNWSLYTDTAVYFLTTNAVTANKRYTDPGNNVAGNVLPAETYFTYTLSKYYKDDLNKGYGVYLGELINSSSYESAEGWGSVAVGAGKTVLSRNINPLLYVYTSGPTASLSATVAGNSSANRTVTVRLNGNIATSGTANGFNITTLKNTNISLSVFTSDTATLSFSHSGVSDDNIVIASYQVTYPRQFNFGNTSQFTFEMPASGAKYIEVSNFNGGVAAPVLYDLANNQRITAVVAGGLAKFVLPASSVTRKFVMLNANAVNAYAVNSFTTRTFTNYLTVANQGDYLIVSHSNLFNDGKGNDYVEQYRQYRSSAAGGSYNAKTILIDQLIDQFAYGVKHHPSAIRNFAAYALAKFGTQPKFLFLIGKGINYSALRRNQTNANIEKYAMVPTFGFPSSDNILTATRTGEVATIPTGRLSVITGTEVGIYLNKVKEFELAQASANQTISGKKWMKNIAHITGGLTDAGLAALVNYYMNNYEAVIKDSLFGADVYDFSKNSGSNTAAGKSKTLEGLFEEGLSMVTYFGHSSPNAIEFNLDNPNSYNNPGKYPLIVINGCNSGDLFLFDTLRPYTGGALSEKFVLADKKGSIAYIANTHFGLPTQLDYVNTAFYDKVSRSMYGQPLGNIIKSTMQDVYNSHTTDYIAQTHVEEINLHGDPAIRINPHARADYVIQDSLVSFTPEQISAADTKVDIKARIINIGRAVNDSLTVRIQRKYPDNTVVNLTDLRIPAPAYSDSISFTLNLNPVVDTGTHQIIVTLDPANEIAELSETNNTVTKSFTVIADEIRPVWPYNFAVTDNSNIALFASVANPLAGAKQYVMQMDTSELFNSPLKVTKTITAKGGVLKFVPGSILKDSTVYYWRVGVGPVAANTRWLSSSFVYINGGQEGFNQSHFYQYKKNSFSGITIDSASYQFGFDEIARQLLIRTGLYPYYSWDQININVDQNQLDYYGCVYNALQFAVYDPLTLQPWKNFPVSGKGSYNSYPVCSPQPDGSRYIFEFPYDDTSYRRKAMEFFDAVPNGYFISVTNLGYTGNTTFINKWKADTSLLGSGKSLWHKFHEYGLHKIDSFSKNLPFLFVFKKGDTVSYPIKQYMGATQAEQVIGIDYVPGNSLSGKMESTWFGPVNFWNRFKWNEKVQAGSTTSRTFDIIGKNTSGNEIQLATVYNSKDTTIDFIDATIYPYLKIRMNNSDVTNIKTTQLKNWMLTSDNVPEGAVSPYNVFAVPDTLSQADTMHLKVQFVNVSNILFDSIKVRLSITDINGRVQVYNNLPNGARYNQLIGGDSVLVTYDIPLASYFGQLQLKLEVNPDDDQPEMYHYNNYIFKSLYVSNGPVCPGVSQVFDAGNNTAGNAFQWQINTGGGYTNLNNGGVYTGATTGSLQLNNVQTSMDGYRYRCRIINNSITTYSQEYILAFVDNKWTGAVNNDWTVAGNWSCNTVPDANINVVIPAGLSKYPIITNGVIAVCKTITAVPGSSVQVNTGGKLDIKGQ